MKIPPKLIWLTVTQILKCSENFPYLSIFTCSTIITGHYIAKLNSIRPEFICDLSLLNENEFVPFVMQLGIFYEIASY